MNTGPEPSDIEVKGDWNTRFRELQKLGAELADASGVEVEEIPQILREERRNAKPEDLAEARQLVDNVLARRQAGK